MDLNKKNYNMVVKLGIIAGSGLLPSAIADLHLERGGEVYVAALQGETDISSIINYPHKQFPMGSVGAIIDYFAENEVAKVIIIGAIKRPNFKSIKVDAAGSALITMILKEKFLGDNSVLKIISNFIESKGFEVISPKDLLKISRYEKLYTTIRSPSRQDQVDIELGRQILKSLGKLDIGQSVIVANNYALGIEAAEGTDFLIERCGPLKTRDGKIGSGVLVKTAKLEQDLRLDIPAIGPNTVYGLAKHDYNGIAIEKSKVIIIKPRETIKLLNKHNLFLTYLNFSD